MAAELRATPRPLCVLSAGRSGTSLVARALNLMGVELGPESDMLEANHMNERGFWENRRIIELNDAILAKRGGTLWEPPPAQPGWHRDARFDQHRRQAAALVAEMFADAPLWGFKDPRTALTLPVWRAVVGELDYVLCARPAAEVIKSARRNMPGEDGRRLVQWWLDLNASLLTETVGARRLVVRYADWFDDPRATARRLAAFVHGDAHAVAPEVYTAIEGFFDPSLRNFEAADDEALDDHPPEVPAMYALLELSAASEPGADAEQQAQVATLAQALADGHRRRASAQIARWEAEARAAELVEGRRVGEQEHQRATADLVAREQQLAGQVADLHASITWAQRYIRDLEQWRDDLLAERDVLRQELAGAAEARAAAEDRAAEARRRLGGLEASASWRATAPLRAVRRRLRQPT